MYDVAIKGFHGHQFVQSDYLSWLANDPSKPWRLYVRVAVSIFSKARKAPKYQFVCLDVVESKRLVPAF